MKLNLMVSNVERKTRLCEAQTTNGHIHVTKSDKLLRLQSTGQWVSYSDGEVPVWQNYWSNQSPHVNGTTSPSGYYLDPYSGHVG